MWTIVYKGYWIHGYCNADVCTVQTPDMLYLGGWRGHKTIHAAKCAITKHIKAATKPKRETT